jgi:hypothetical protein
MAPDQICPKELAMPLPAMSGAEPCTGSNSEVALHKARLILNERSINDAPYSCVN